MHAQSWLPQNTEYKIMKNILLFLDDSFFLEFHCGVKKGGGQLNIFIYRQHMIA
jgi:hypothetical protein